MQRLTREHRALLLELHRIIRESADETARTLGAETGALTYPPGGSPGAWTRGDTKALASLQLTAAQRRALGKVFADHSASVIFQCLSLIDGVTDPELTRLKHWAGLRLVVPNDDEDGEMLHDAFFDTYANYARKTR